jgi:class I fructose-bisphosphate aldolase
VSQAFAMAHELGMATVLWVLPPQQRVQEGKGLPRLGGSLRSGQSSRRDHQADIIKQSSPKTTRGYNAMGPATARPTNACTRNSRPTTRSIFAATRSWCYQGRIGLINSSGASGDNDFAEAVKTAVINKRAGGSGLISGRKAFQRPMKDGVRLLNLVQEVYLDRDITIA